MRKHGTPFEITVPSTVSTSTEPTEIPVTVQNKSGQIGYGTVSFIVSKNIDSGIPPEIVSATVSPESVAREAPQRLLFSNRNL